jgi:mono/diheme cytochrome c family protein
MDARAFFHLCAPFAAALLLFLASPAPAQDGTLDPLAAAGKVIFEVTAGGVGCAKCHGMDGRGNVGPNIRGRSASAVQRALRNVGEMDIVNLSDAEIEQVVAYLQFLDAPAAPPPTAGP